MLAKMVSGGFLGTNSGMPAPVQAKPLMAAGYATGLILTYLALCFRIGGSSGQPALLYLVPCTLGTMVILALIRGDLRSLVLGRDGKLAKIEDREALPGSGRSSDFGAGSSEHAQLLEHS